MRTTVRRVLRVLATVAAFSPALGAGDCFEPTAPAEKSYDGRYYLAAVNGDYVSYVSPFYMYGAKGDANSLRLVSGEWSISGSTLSTTMTTIAKYGGKDDPAFAEKHTGTITISGSSVTAVLNSGTTIYATMGSDAITYSSGSATLTFKPY